MHFLTLLAAESEAPVNFRDAIRLKPLFERFNRARLAEEVAATNAEMRVAGEVAG